MTISRHSVRLWPTLVGVLVLLSFVSGAWGVDAWADRGTTRPPAKGLFLVATPQLTDPNFAETVVLICEHGGEGTLGLIVNRPTPMRLAEALPQVGVLKGTSYQVYWGGPVEPNGLMLLYRLAEGNAEMREVLKEVYVGGQLETVERLITQPRNLPRLRRLCRLGARAVGNGNDLRLVGHDRSQRRSDLRQESRSSLAGAL